MDFEKNLSDGVDSTEFVELMMGSGLVCNDSVVLEHGALSSLLALLNHDKKHIKKEACWEISNITAVIDARIVIVLVQLLTNAEFEIKREAACAMSNAISGGTYEQLLYSYLDYFIFHITISLHHTLENVFLVLVGRSLEIKGCIKPLCDLAICSNPEIVISCLEGLEKILMHGEASKNSMGHDNEYVQLVEEVEGTEKIDGLKISLS
ncbi:hypothetical protein RJ640_010059 [Escallonia rubra]|uniref:Uncharacterized protein n=1 Tax=Escallonia rubra TaxID=112253 RepID=A0AA88RNX9_9ASTE|nr:hypothetical protein RJ640_010059 [Escallonia rubra]